MANLVQLQLVRATGISSPAGMSYLHVPSLDFEHPRKKQKRYPQLNLDFDDMAFFAPSMTSTTQFLAAPPPVPSRKRSQRLQRPRDDVDDFLSSDLELSFASTMSLHSPPHEPITLTPGNESADLMDISPTHNPVFTLPSSKKDESASKPKNRPRAFTSGTRIFGRDMSNGPSPSLAAPAPSILKSGGSQSNAKRLQRSALPLEWMADSEKKVAEDVIRDNVFAVSYFDLGWASGFEF